MTGRADRTAVEMKRVVEQDQLPQGSALDPLAARIAAELLAFLRDADQDFGAELSNEVSPRREID